MFIFKNYAGTKSALGFFPIINSFKKYKEPLYFINYNKII